MLNTSFRPAIFAALMSACAVFGTGCYAEVQAEGPAPEVVDGYQAQYYDGYVVYYDTVGRPYYYNNGAVYWVPATSPYYGTYVNHWRAYGPSYNRWYSRSGYRYRTWRAAPVRRYR
jgi:hypothetical protein